MKHLKTFENINNNLNVGDYVLIKDDILFTELYREFLRSHIGKVNHITHDIFHVDFSLDKFNEFPRSWYKNQMFNIHHLEFSSKNKEDVDVFLNSKKYNL